MALKYKPFAASRQLVNAAKSNPPVGKGAHGSGVYLIQGALIDLGFELPVSTRKHHKPDGIYGKETTQVVADYQTSRRLKKPDGIVGRDTMEALDNDMSSGSHPIPSKPPVPIPPPADAEYTTGTNDPPLAHDPGAGQWNSKETEATYVALKLAILAGWQVSASVIGDDAEAHMWHYLNNSGGNYQIDLDGMVSEVPSAKKRYEREVSQAQKFVEKLPAGTHDITSKHGEQGYNRKDENANWFFAIGGYTTWGKGRATVTESAGQKTYSLVFEYKFYDRYNWDGGKSVTIADIEITDDFMGEFHRQGIAREYNCFGSFKRLLQWKQGEAIAAPQLYQPLGGRS